MRRYWEKTRDFVSYNRESIRSTVGFAGKCIEAVANLTQLEKPTTYSYIHTAFKCKDAWEEYFKKENTDYFLNDRWEAFSCRECWTSLVAILKKEHSQKIKVIKSDQSGHNAAGIFLAIFPEVEFGWVSYTTGVHSMHISAGKQEKAIQILKDILWKCFGKSVHVESIRENYTVKFGFQADDTHDKFINSPSVVYYANYIKQFAENGYGRSLLFYGPPGTGKSNLVRGVANSLGMKALRLKQLNEVRNKALCDVISLFDPDVVVMEDIDHVYAYEISTLLEKMEDLNRRGKYVLATANEISKINSALIRPDRFDQLVEIKHPDPEYVRQLLNDDELYELVKNFPIAYINEVLKRIKSLGRQGALANIEDIRKRVDNLNKNDYSL